MAFFKYLKIYKEQLRFVNHFWFPFQRICHCAGSDCIKICIYTLLFVDFVLRKITNIFLFFVFFLSNLVFLLPLAREIPRMGNANSMTTNCCFRNAIAQESGRGESARYCFQKCNFLGLCSKPTFHSNRNRDLFQVGRILAL